jgi:hypothetical protein
VQTITPYDNSSSGCEQTLLEKVQDMAYTAPASGVEQSLIENNGGDSLVSIESHLPTEHVGLAAAAVSKPTVA